ncbi:thiamine-phosphate kinase [Brevibacillus borstelensis]|uniref:thiamine-phosphate kinase n=1 Tax=Brevibacillus borstelensis TaxID=45462 RepID=UPI0004F2AAAD|nr:thiamine-phosphate kinase [Brevibacillus borstelensis]KKX54864.1 thiamine-monophosphate kinase [Brevibacillus borstelensis cifa_chp40]
MTYDEFSLIRRWTSRSAGQTGDGLSVGIGDDAAVFSLPADREVVACCDAMVETVHFLKETMNPSDIGYKAVISNISDVAAMGGIPKYALISIAVSPNWTAKECQQIYDGIYAACEAYGVRVIGGDTVSSPAALSLSVTVMGEVEKGRALLRSAAKPGQLVFVTGHVGGSAAGLDLLLQTAKTGEAVEEMWQPLVAFHQRPVAQVAAGRILAASANPGALNDVSDGLASELWEISEASGVCLRIEAELIPVAETTRMYASHKGKDPLHWALYGGEDYQLAGTIEAVEEERIGALFAQQGIPFTVIGRVEVGGPSVVMNRNSRWEPVAKAGFNHFGKADARKG